MKKVCVITGARSEYGLLRWVIDGIEKDEDLQLQLVVTGGHLSPEQGLTYQAIEDDGYHIDEKVEMLLSSETSVGISKSMGLCSIGMADTFNRLKPDMIVVLGDRYELLPIVGTALVMRIPVWKNSTSGGSNPYSSIRKAKVEAEAAKFTVINVRNALLSDVSKA